MGVKTLGWVLHSYLRSTNYYQGKTTDFDEWDYLFKSFRDGHNLNNLFMEMECDSGVKNSEELRTRACKYVQYAKNFPHRAYYYGTDIENLVTVKRQCPDYIR